jgi:hypothetical protein
MAKKPEHELERVTATLSQEIRDQAERLSKDLFPKGPPGSQTMSRDAELDMVARHWNDPTFRKTLLTRMAPPGPNGYPDPILAQKFIDLYFDAVLKRGSLEQDVPHSQSENAAVQPPSGSGSPGPPPGPLPLDGGGPATLGQMTANPAVSPTPPGVPPETVPTTPPEEPGATQVAQNVAPPQGSFAMPTGVPPPPPFPEEGV